MRIACGQFFTVAHRDLPVPIRWRDVLLAFLGGLICAIAVCVVGIVLFRILSYAAAPSGGPARYDYFIHIDALLRRNAVLLGSLGGIVFYFVLGCFVWGYAKQLSLYPAATSFKIAFSQSGVPSYPDRIRRFFPPVSTRFLWWAFASAWAVLLPIILLCALLEFVTGADFTSSMRGHEPRTALEYVVALVEISVAAPLVEELFFRGFVLDWLRQKMPVWRAAAVSSLIFSLAHGTLVHFPGVQGVWYVFQLWGDGMVMSYWAIHTGSLRPGVVFHATSNAILVSAAYGLNFI